MPKKKKVKYNNGRKNIMSERKCGHCNFLARYHSKLGTFEYSVLKVELKMYV